MTKSVPALELGLEFDNANSVLCIIVKVYYCQT